MANADRTPSQQSQSPQTQPPSPQTQTRTENTDVQRREHGRGQSHMGLTRMDPFGMLIERLFEGFGLGRSALGLGHRQGRLPRQAQAASQEVVDWVPNIELSQQANELIVRADLPGMEREDIDVEITGDTVVIRGERRQERREQDEYGWMRTEVSYGSFVRAVPLPEGTIADSASATFKNGVLEVRLQTPPQEVNETRKVNIQ